MEPSFAVFYQLLLDLTSAAYGKNYQDPVQRTEAGSYSEICRSDASFKQETEDMKQAIDDLIEAHGGTNGTGGMRSAIAGHNFASPFSNNTGVRGKTYVQCITGTQAGTGASAGVTSVENELSTYKNGIKNRITEITNRIGYLNGKNPAVSGNTSFQLVGPAGSGFTGYAFNGGAGYANTIYSHANFMAGLKINLLGKILTAISDVDGVYDQITAKRSEYYEYNQ